MQVETIAPEAKSTAVLPGAGFSDAYRLVVDEPGVDAITYTRRIMGRTPGWISGLLTLRNRLVALLGLKPARLALHERLDESAEGGAFPIISRAPERVVLGFDDKHLDFRIVVDVVGIDLRRRQITATTLVRTHNLLGRIYLASILPFHRVIVPAMLARAEQT